MIDCDAAQDDRPFRQGDIFVYVKWSDRTVWDRIGVLLTADCDIEQSKFGRYLTYLPIMRIADYVDNVVIPQNLDRRLNTALRDVRSLYTKGRKAVDSNALEPTSNAIESWVVNGTMSDLSTIVLLSNKEHKRLSELKDLIRECMRTRGESGCRQRALLTQLQGVLQNKKKSDWASTVRNDIRSALLNPPHDVYFVSHIPGLPGDLANGLGFFVQLREARPLPADGLVAKVSAAPETGAVRVARLSPTFTHALTQRFSHLFARIGHPREFEDDQREIIEMTCRDLEL